MASATNSAMNGACFRHYHTTTISMKSINLLAIIALELLLASPPPARATSPETTAEENSLMNNAKAFVDAFEKGDAKAVAAFWADDGDYVDVNGRHLQGRSAIENAFKDFFAENKGLKLRIDVNSVRFVTPDTAIEDGTTSVISPDGTPPNQTRYTNVHVKKDGQWVLQSVHEAPYTPPGNYEHLRGLEWAVGEWVDEGEGPEIDHATFEWSPDGNFLISTQDVTVKDTLVSRATEWIGWDPAASQVHSWSFVADGSIGENTWSNEGDQWIIKTNAILPNGKKLAATNSITRNGPDEITWQSKDRTLDGKALPDVKEIKMKRVP
jgi:uncharacterized protein (TIGR02246 family)